MINSTKLRDTSEKHLPKWLYKPLLAVYRSRLIVTNFGKPVGSWQTAKFLFLDFFGKSKTVYLPGVDLFAHTDYKTLTTLIEVYNRELYSSLTDLECVLDAGAFIGESSRYLLKHNKSVVAIEPSKEKYKLLSQNIKGKNITGYNAALVATSEKTITLYSASEFDFCSTTLPNSKASNKEVVPAVHIKKIMETHELDGLKMDIEGAEFPIIKYFCDHPKRFTFKKGIIEFHFNEDKQQRVDTVFQFIKMLEGNGCAITLYDNYNNVIQKADINEGFVQSMNMLFTR